MSIRNAETDIEIVKDFLNSRGYISTLECLTKEHASKTVEIKNSQVKINYNYILDFFWLWTIIIKINSILSRISCKKPSTFESC